MKEEQRRDLQVQHFYYQSVLFYEKVNLYLKREQISVREL